MIRIGRRYVIVMWVVVLHYPQGKDGAEAARAGA